jgi:AraC family transcriptional regulator, exoenzyme S synthesis regulatory protein ExsA
MALPKTKSIPVGIAEYCADNTLIIPEGLAGFQDAQCVMQARSQAIYHKLIRKSMEGVEFFTSTPCLCYPLRGTETFRTGEGETLVVEPGTFLMMPRDTFMVSDFINDEGPLEAFLFFFDDRCIAEFLRISRLDTVEEGAQDAYKIAAHDSLAAYVASLHTVYSGIRGGPALLQTKLVELLLLIAEIDAPKRLRNFLRTAQRQQSRRYIPYLMENYASHNLSVADYAQLSGRSISSFNRDFRRRFGMGPSQWLMAQRLDRARDALLNTGASITEISMDIGYANTSHFIKQFKKKFGCTPRRFRREHSGDLSTPK